MPESPTFEQKLEDVRSGRTKAFEWNGPIDARQIEALCHLLGDHPKLERLRVRADLPDSGEPGATPQQQGAEAGARIITALSGTTSLKDLDVAVNGVVPAQAIAECLRRNRSIESVHLNNGGLDDDGVAAIAEALKVNGTVTQVDLRNSQIGDAGAEKLAEALAARDCAIMHLNLFNSGLSDVGAEMIAAGVAHNSSLTTLWIGRDTVSQAGIEALAEGVAQSKTIMNVDDSFRWARTVRVDPVLSANAATANGLFDQVRDGSTLQSSQLAGLAERASAVRALASSSAGIMSADEFQNLLAQVLPQASRSSFQFPGQRAAPVDFTALSQDVLANGDGRRNLLVQAVRAGQTAEMMEFLHAHGDGLSARDGMTEFRQTFDFPSNQWRSVPLIKQIEDQRALGGVLAERYWVGRGRDLAWLLSQVDPIQVQLQTGLSPAKLLERAGASRESANPAVVTRQPQRAL